MGGASPGVLSMIATKRIRRSVCVSFLVCLVAGCSAEVAGPNRAPVAIGGPDLSANEGDTVRLDASASFDPDGDDLHFDWRVPVAPVGAVTTVREVGHGLADLEVDRPGVWLVRLVVDDGRSRSVPDVVQVRVAAAAACSSDDDCPHDEVCATARCEAGRWLPGGRGRYPV